MIRTEGVVYEIVKAKLESLGIETSTLKIATFGVSTYHEIVLNDRIVGSYERNSKEFRFYNSD